MVPPVGRRGWGWRRRRRSFDINGSFHPLLLSPSPPLSPSYLAFINGGNLGRPTQEEQGGLGWVVRQCSGGWKVEISHIQDIFLKYRAVKRL